MIDFLLSTPVFLLAFLAVISFVVVIHELGHYWVGRWNGVHAAVFSIGFGPTLFSWTDREGTLWRVAALPLGGYVRFLGDDNAASAPDHEALEALKKKVEREKGPDAVNGVFHFKPVWRRASIVAAGPIANFLLAIVIFTAFYLFLGENRIPPVAVGVVPGSAAEEAGFEPGDRVIAINGRRADAFMDITNAVMLSAGERLEFLVERNGEEVTLIATPRREERPDPVGATMSVGFLGIQATQEQEITRYGPVTALGLGVDQTVSIVTTTGRYVGRIFQGKESADMLGGPLRIATVTGKTAVDTLAMEATAGEKLRALVVRLITLAGVISVGLGMINLLPVPVLDGGHLLYYAYESIAGRPLSEDAQIMGFRIGLALIVGLMLFATWNDLFYIGQFFS